VKANLVNDGDLKTWVVILDKGEETSATLLDFARREGIGAAQVTAIGAFSEAVLGYFDWSSKEYRRIPVKEQVEVLSLIGDIALDPSGKPSLHLHATLGRADGGVVGGHLLEGRVRPTLEIVVNEPPAHLRKKKDPETGLALIACATRD
jgi:hypothetical protein